MSTAPTGSTEARSELTNLSPRLAKLLAEYLPELTQEVFEMLKTGLKATYKVDYTTPPSERYPKGRKRSKIMPDNQMRKWCAQRIIELQLQALDRGGASAVKTTELAGSLDVNNSHKVLQTYDAMSPEERDAEIARLERVAAIPGGSAATGLPAEVQQGLRRRPVIPG